MNSYRRAAAAYKSGDLGPELFSVSVETKRGKPPIIVSEDEDYKKVNFEKFTQLTTVFQREGGTITAGNSSSLSDGKGLEKTI
jgi:acetyl-CoA C-acetyltransferase